MPTEESILAAVSLDSEEKQKQNTVNTNAAAVNDKSPFDAAYWYLQSYPAEKAEAQKTQVKPEPKVYYKPPENTEPDKIKNAGGALSIVKKVLKVLAFIILGVAILFVISVIIASANGSRIGNYNPVNDSTVQEEQPLGSDGDSLDAAIYVGETQLLTIREGEEYIRHFYPGNGGLFRIYSSGSTDTIARVYDGSGALIGEFDDAEDTNFDFTIKLNSFEEYTIKISAFEPGGETSVTVTGA